MENKQNLKMQIRKIIINEQSLDKIIESIAEIFNQYNRACDKCIDSLNKIETNQFVKEAIRKIADEKDDEESFSNCYIR